ncbi:hypothetical protein YTPLAS18_32230 [Nitrospira sp.]|nr:hypothetical protein YTPLAS18_32230 [Nitrospira sp.]
MTILAQLLTARVSPYASGKTLEYSGSPLGGRLYITQPFIREGLNWEALRRSYNP